MTKEEIGAILKQLRISSGKTQKEVAEILGRKQQIVGHWETGYSQPDANTLFTLCDIYGTSVDNAFGFKKSSVSRNDLKLLERYHNLDSSGQEHVNTILSWETDRIQQLQDTQRESLAAIVDFQKYDSAKAPLLNAAHERTDIEITDEMRQHDDDIMNDDSEWE